MAYGTLEIGRTWKHGADIGDMHWPRAGNRCGDIEWKMRHAPDSLTSSDLLVAASILAAYRELIFCTREKRQAVVAALRAVEDQHPVESEI